MAEDELVIGDKVELIKEAGSRYKTMIEDMYGGGSFLVGVPSRAGAPMALQQDDEVLLVFYRESGRYACPMQVLRLEKSETIKFAVLLQKAKPYHDQRRGAYRLRKEIRIQIFEYCSGDEDKLHTGREAGPDDPAETVRAEDISITGLSLNTRGRYEHNDKLVLKLHLSDQKGAQTGGPELFYTCAKVVRVSPGLDRKTNNIGLHYFGQTQSMNDHLAKFVAAEQQKLIKRRRLK